MPLVRYEIRSEHSLANPDLYRATKDEPEGLLEGVATAGLVGIVRQIGDLAEFAADIFRDLHEEVMTVSAKGHDLAIRVQQIEAEMPSIEKALLSETNQLKYAYNAGTEWHASIRTDQNHCTQGDLPRFIRNSYEECRGPPRLFLLDKFDVAGAGACLKRYTDPSYFKTEWATSELMKAEREQKARKKKKGRRRKDNPNSVDTMPVTQINSRVRYSSRGVETDGPPGPSASLNSEYLAKQSREAQPPSRGPDASSVSGSSVSSVALSETQTRVAPPARRGAESGSKTEYLKQPRLGLPPGRIMEIGGGKGSSKVEQQGKTSKEVLPVTRGVGTDAPAKRQISTIPEQLALQMRETIAGGAGDNSQVTSAKLPPSRHTRQPSGSDTLSSLGLGSALQVDEPLKLNAKEIEAETLSGRFVRVHPKLDLVSETNEANSKGQVSRFNQVDDKAQSIPPLDRPPGHEQVQPPTSDEQELLVKPPSNRFESQALEQIPPADGADDLAGDADHFLDALATMESDGETDAEPRTSGAQLSLDAQATSAPSSQDTVDHKTLTDEEDSKTHVVDSPKGIAALDIEASANSPADSLASPSPTTFNEALPSPSLTVHSSELMSPSSVGTYSVDEDEEPVLTPTGQGLARVAEELPSSSEAALPGEVQSGSEVSEPLISSETAQGPPSSSSQFAMPSRQPPSPPRLSKPVISPREVVGPPRDATGSIFNKVHPPAIDPPSPSGTVVVLPSPVNALGSPWDLVSPAGSTSDVSSPRRFGGSARDVLSPTASNASEADLAPKLKSLGVTANAFPAEELPTDLKPPGNELLSPSGIDPPLSSPSTTVSEEAAEVVTESPGVDSFPQTSLPDEYVDMPASVNKDRGGSGDLKEAVGTDVAEQEVKGGEAEKPEQPSEGDQPAEKVLSKDFEGHQDQHITKGISDKAEELTAGIADEQVTHEEELAAVDPLLHLLSSEDEVDEELDEELAEAARSSRVSPPRAPPPRAPSPPAPPSPPSSQSPKAHRFSVLDPLSLSDTEANDPELSPGGSDGSSPKSSIFSALHSPMSPPLHGRKLLDSPGSRSARSFRASEVLDPTSPTHSPRPELQRSPTAKSLPEIMPPVPPLHPGQWHERKPSIPLEFGRSPSRIPPPPPPIPSTRTKQPSPPPAPMPTRRAPIAGEQDALMDAIAAHDRSQLRKVSLSLQASPSRSSPTQDREGLLQQIRSQSFSLRETKSSPRVQPETLQRPVTNINVAAILEKANAIRQAFTGSDDEDDEDDRWSDTT